MPQKNQIVPKYQHPHVETYINDYTQYKDEETATVDSSNKFITVFKSESGIDNVLVKKSSLSDFTKTYGTSNYEKYGQPLMMPIGILSSGSATVYCMRIMPDDAFAANSVLNLLYKTDEESGKMIIKFQASYVDKSMSGFEDSESYKTQKAFKKSLRQHARAMETSAPDDDGFISVPIVTFRMNGRGTYGNEYRWRIVQNTTYEKEYEIKMYTFEVITSSGGLEKVASYVGSLVTSPNYSTSLTFINDVIDEEEMSNVIMDVQVIEENVEKVYNVFKKFVEGLSEDLQDPNGIPDIDEFDPFFGRQVASTTKNKNIMIVNESITGDEAKYLSEDDISVDRPQGVTLSGGDDGMFDVSKAKYIKSTINAESGETENTTYSGEQAVAMATDDMYIRAFNGELDRTIISTRRRPCIALLDANYSYAVKDELAKLANMRESTLLYLDAGIDTTTSNINKTIEKLEMYNTRNISKCIQHYTTKDPTTQKRCEVTMTYFLAQKLATHFTDEGSWVPFVKSRARLSGHIKDSVEPCIDDIDSDLKEVLYTNRINYFECVEENVYERATQVTAQEANSDLIEENNMYTLYEIKRIIESDCWDSLYDFTSAEKRADFTRCEMAKFASWSGVRLDSIEISFGANEWEAERSIVHCYVSVKFRNLMKRAIIEIDVNKRDFIS